MESAADYRDTIGVVLAGGRRHAHGRRRQGAAPPRRAKHPRADRRHASRRRSAGVVLSANGDPRRLRSPRTARHCRTGPVGPSGRSPASSPGLAHAAQLGVPCVVSVPVATRRSCRAISSPGCTRPPPERRAGCRRRLVRARRIPPSALWPVSALADLDEAVLVQGIRRRSRRRLTARLGAGRVDAARSTPSSTSTRRRISQRPRLSSPAEGRLTAPDAVSGVLSAVDFN